MTDCLILQPIAAEGVELLRRSGLEVSEAPATDLGALAPHLATARAVITRNAGFSADAIAAAPQLQIIAAHGTGTDRIDMAAAARRGIRVVNTPGANAQSVAEHALALIFACARDLPAADRAVRAGDWDRRERRRPMDLRGLTLGVVGFGHTARHLARLAHALGMSVMAFSTHASAKDFAEHGVTQAETLDALLVRADIVSLHGSPGSAPRLNSSHLNAMRPSAFLINTARGALLDEDALADALKNGRLAGAALDVFATEPPPPDSPLLSCPNLLLTPHIGGSGTHALRRTALEVARKVISGLGLPLPD